MDQEYKTIQEYIRDYRGFTLKPRVQEDIRKYLYEQKLAWAYHHREQLSPEVMATYVTDPGTREILDLGGSVPSDLILNQWGIWFAKMHKTPTANATDIGSGAVDGGTWSDSTGTNANDVIFYPSGANTGAFGGGKVAGTALQLGSGTTAPARADVTLTTAFGTAPESTYFGSGTGAYSAGTMTMSGSITSGGSGTINEGVLFFRVWDNGTSSLKNWCLVHDLITANAFTAGKSLTLQSSWTF